MNLLWYLDHMSNRWCLSALLFCTLEVDIGDAWISMTRIHIVKPCCEEHINLSSLSPGNQFKHLNWSCYLTCLFLLKSRVRRLFFAVEARCLEDFQEDLVLTVLQFSCVEFNDSNMDRSVPQRSQRFRCIQVNANVFGSDAIFSRMPASRGWLSEVNAVHIDRFEFSCLE